MEQRRRPEQEISREDTPQTLMYDNWLGTENTSRFDRASGISMHMTQDVFALKLFYIRIRGNERLLRIERMLHYYWSSLSFNIFSYFPQEPPAEPLYNNVLTILADFPWSQENTLAAMLGVEYALRLRRAMTDVLSSFDMWFVNVRRFINDSEIDTVINDFDILASFRYFSHRLPYLAIEEDIPDYLRITLQLPQPSLVLDEPCTNQKLPPFVQYEYANDTTTPITKAKQTVQVNVMPENRSFTMPLFLYDNLESLKVRVSVELGTLPELLYITQKRTRDVTRLDNNNLHINMINESESLSLYVLNMSTLVDQLANIIKTNLIHFKATMKDFMTKKGFSRDKIYNFSPLEWQEYNIMNDTILDDLTTPTFNAFFELSRTGEHIDAAPLRDLVYLHAVPRAMNKEPVSFWSNKKEAEMLLFNFQTLQTKFKLRPFLRFTPESLVQRNKTKMYQMSLYESSAENLSFKVSEIKLKTYVIEGELKMSNTDIFSIFNNLVMTSDIPFCYINNSFVKVINNVAVPREWYKTSEDDEEDASSSQATTEEGTKMYVYVRVTNTDTFDNPKDFVRVTLIESSSTTLRDQRRSIQLEIEANAALNEKLLFSNMSKMFRVDVDAYLERRFNSGVVGFSNLQLSKFSLEDFAYNNKLFSSTFELNQRNLLHRKDQRIQMNLKIGNNEHIGMYLKYYVDNRYLDELYKTEARIRNQHMYQLNLENKSKLKINFGEVKKATLKFISCLNILLQSLESFEYKYYCVLATNVQAFITSTFTPQTLPAQTTSAPSSVENVIVAPEVFMTSFSDICSLDNQPIFVRLGEEGMTEAQFVAANPNKVYIIYPPTGERKYIAYCANEEATITLQENCVMSNRQQFPYVPCCFAGRSDVRIKGMLLKEYKQYVEKGMTLSQMQDDQRLEQQKKAPKKVNLSTKPLERTRMLQPNQLGQLNKPVFSMLMLSSNEALSGKLSFLRSGSPFTYLTATTDNWRVLSTLQLATNKTVIVEQLKALVRQGLMHSTLQARFLNEDDAIRALDQQGFIDPQLWLPVLQEAFKVEILLFSDQTLLSEYFMRTRIIDTKPRYDKTVLLSINAGSKYNCAEHAQTELIVGKLIKDKKLEFTFSTSSELVQALMKLRDQMYPTVKLNNVAQGSTSQSFDGLGYTRSITINNYTLITDPMFNVASQSINVSNQLLVQALPIAAAKNILGNNAQLVVYNQNVIGAFTTQQDNLRLFIKIEPEVKYKPEMGIQADMEYLDYFLNPAKSKVDFASNYYKFKRNANYLTSYVLWAFSNAASGDINRSTINEWFDNNVVSAFAGSPLDYNVRELTFNNGQIFNASGQLVFPAKDEKQYENIKSRLKFAVEMMLGSNKEKLVGFKKLMYVPNFYNSSTEFDQSDEYSVYNSVDEYNLVASASTSAAYQVQDKVTVQDRSYFVKWYGKTMLAARFATIEEVILAYASYQATNKNTLYATTDYYPANSTYMYIDEQDNVENMNVPSYRRGGLQVNVDQPMVVVKRAEDVFYGLFEL